MTRPTTSRPPVATGARTAGSAGGNAIEDAGTWSAGTAMAR